MYSELPVVFYILKSPCFLPFRALTALLTFFVFQCLKKVVVFSINELKSNPDVYEGRTWKNTLAVWTNLLMGQLN